MVKGLAAGMICLLLSGCVSLNGLPCNVGPFRPDAGASERWTRGEKEQLVVINRTGERFCRWEA